MLYNVRLGQDVVQQQIFVIDILVFYDYDVISFKDLRVVCLFLFLSYVLVCSNSVDRECVVLVQWRQDGWGFYFFDNIVDREKIDI